MNEKFTKKLEQMLLKKALGFKVREITEEYSFDNASNEMILVKKKVSTKYIPPDVSAARAYAEHYKLDENVSIMTDSQLSQEKQRLLLILQQINDENDLKNQGEEQNASTDQIQD